MNGLGLLFSFRGRINRAKFWLAVLFYFLIVFAYVAGIIWAAGGIDTNDPGKLVDGFFASAMIGLVIGLIMTVSGFAVGIKRLHDRNKSGWWYLLFWLGPSVASALQIATFDPAMKFVFGVISFAIIVWSFIELGCLNGAAGPNQYGPDPLNRFSTEPLR